MPFHRKQWEFVRDNLFGVVATIGIWACMAGLRSFRDFYTQKIFSAALNGTPTSKVYVLADVPGAVLSFVFLVMMSWVHNSQRALFLMLLTNVAGLLLMAGCTYLFRLGELDGMDWILLYSAAFYAAYSVLNAPLNERIFAVTRAEGTCSFLIYASDFFGYVVTVGLLMYQSFGPLAGTSNIVVLDLFVSMLYVLTGLMTLLAAGSMCYFWREKYGRRHLHDAVPHEQRFANYQLADTEEFPSIGASSRTVPKRLVLENIIGEGAMDITIHITASGAASTIALSLDLMTAIAHVSSILQMCSLYAESRESQTEAQHQLKMHMEKLNFIQNRVLRQQKQRVASRGRVMRPLPAILCSGHMGQDSEDCDGFHPAIEVDLEERSPPRPCVRELSRPPVPPGSPALALSDDKDDEVPELPEVPVEESTKSPERSRSHRPEDSSESVLELGKPDEHCMTVTPEIPATQVKDLGETKYSMFPSRIFNSFWRKSNKVSPVSSGHSRLSKLFWWALLYAAEIAVFISALLHLAKHFADDSEIARLAVFFVPVEPGSFQGLGERTERRRQAPTVPRGSLRPSTRNDEKRARKAARQEAELQEEKIERIEFLERPERPEGREVGHEVWEDIPEAVLFEMFDDAKAVEEALLRFAGSSHQAARALEALLARPDTKAVEGEDDLDYDCADQEAGDGWEAEIEAADEEMWCAYCGEAIDEADENAGIAEDGQLYCSWCWEEWQEADQEAEPPELPPEPVPEPTVPTMPTVQKRRWAKEGREGKEGKEGKEEAPKIAPSGSLGRAFFESLDGPAKWAEAPKRPEAGGKELVALRPKEERGIEDAMVKGTTRTALLMPKAATVQPVQTPEHTVEDVSTRCSKLLQSIKPPLEDSIVDYLSSMISSSSLEDLPEIQETIAEILEGHDVPSDMIILISKELGREKEPLGLRELGCADGCGRRGEWEMSSEKEPLGMSELGCADGCDGVGARLDARTAADDVGARERVEMGREKEPLALSELGCADGCGRHGCKGERGNG
eukprot:s762_g9.t1